MTPLLHFPDEAPFAARLAAAIPYVFVVNYRAANWFLPTREGGYLGQLEPPPAITVPVKCACGKTYRNARTHMESAAHKKWALGVA